MQQRKKHTELEKEDYSPEEFIKGLEGLLHRHEDQAQHKNPDFCRHPTSPSHWPSLGQDSLGDASLLFTEMKSMSPTYVCRSFR